MPQLPGVSSPGSIAAAAAATAAAAIMSGVPTELLEAVTSSQLPDPAPEPQDAAARRRQELYHQITSLVSGSSELPMLQGCTAAATPVLLPFLPPTAPLLPFSSSAQFMPAEFDRPFTSDIGPQVQHPERSANTNKRPLITQLNEVTLVQDVNDDGRNSSQDSHELLKKRHKVTNIECTADGVPQAATSHGEAVSPPAISDRVDVSFIEATSREDASSQATWISLAEGDQEGPAAVSSQATWISLAEGDQEGPAAVSSQATWISLAEAPEEPVEPVVSSAMPVPSAEEPEASIEGPAELPEGPATSNEEAAERTDLLRSESIQSIIKGCEPPSAHLVSPMDTGSGSAVEGIKVQIMKHVGSETAAAAAGTITVDSDPVGAGTSTVEVATGAVGGASTVGGGAAAASTGSAGGDSAAAAAAAATGSAGPNTDEVAAGCSAAGATAGSAGCSAAGATAGVAGPINAGAGTGEGGTDAVDDTAGQTTNAACSNSAAGIKAVGTAAAAAAAGAGGLTDNGVTSALVASKQSNRDQSDRGERRSSSNDITPGKERQGRGVGTDSLEVRAERSSIKRSYHHQRQQPSDSSSWDMILRGGRGSGGRGGGSEETGLRYRPSRIESPRVPSGARTGVPLPGAREAVRTSEAQRIPPDEIRRAERLSFRDGTPGFKAVVPPGTTDDAGNKQVLSTTTVPAKEAALAKAAVVEAKDGARVGHKSPLNGAVRPKQEHPPPAEQAVSSSPSSSGTSSSSYSSSNSDSSATSSTTSSSSSSTSSSTPPPKTTGKLKDGGFKSPPLPSRPYAAGPTSVAPEIQSAMELGLEAARGSAAQLTPYKPASNKQNAVVPASKHDAVSASAGGTTGPIKMTVTKASSLGRVVNSSPADVMVPVEPSLPSAHGTLLFPSPAVPPAAAPDPLDLLASHVPLALVPPPKQSILAAAAEESSPLPPTAAATAPSPLPPAPIMLNISAAASGSPVIPLALSPLPPSSNKSQTPLAAGSIAGTTNALGAAMGSIAGTTNALGAAMGSIAGTTNALGAAMGLIAGSSALGAATGTLAGSSALGAAMGALAGSSALGAATGATAAGAGGINARGLVSGLAESKQSNRDQSDRGERRSSSNDITPGKERQGRGIDTDRPMEHHDTDSLEVRAERSSSKRSYHHQRQQPSDSSSWDLILRGGRGSGGRGGGSEETGLRYRPSRIESPRVPSGARTGVPSPGAREAVRAREAKQKSPDEIRRAERSDPPGSKLMIPGTSHDASNKQLLSRATVPKEAGYANVTVAEAKDGARVGLNSPLDRSVRPKQQRPPPAEQAAPSSPSSSGTSSSSYSSSNSDSSATSSTTSSSSSTSSSKSLPKTISRRKEGAHKSPPLLSRPSATGALEIHGTNKLGLDAARQLSHNKPASNMPNAVVPASKHDAVSASAGGTAGPIKMTATKVPPLEKVAHTPPPVPDVAVLSPSPVLPPAPDPVGLPASQVPPSPVPSPAPTAAPLPLPSVPIMLNVPAAASGSPVIPLALTPVPPTSHKYQALSTGTALPLNGSLAASASPAPAVASASSSLPPPPQLPIDPHTSSTPLESAALAASPISRLLGSLVPQSLPLNPTASPATQAIALRGTKPSACQPALLPAIITSAAPSIVYPPPPPPPLSASSIKSPPLPLPSAIVITPPLPATACIELPPPPPSVPVLHKSTPPPPAVHTIIKPPAAPLSAPAALITVPAAHLAPAAPAAPITVPAAHLAPAA
ncbi:hypothetical protein CEUSTIGMA_g1283.t1, partial [Chlamydomonas eustigma]